MMIFIRPSELDQVKVQVAALEAAGVQRVMLNWPDFDDLAGITRMARLFI